MEIIKYLNHHINGILIDADSVTLNDKDGLFGIKEAAGNIVIPANTPVVHAETGVYKYDVSHLEEGIEYIIAWKVVTGGVATYKEDIFTIGAGFSITLEEVKTALRIDYDEEDSYLTLCLETAKSHLEDAIDDYNVKILNEKFQNKARLVIFMTVQNLFDNRTYSTMVNEYQADKVKYIISSLMAQMRWA